MQKIIAALIIINTLGSFFTTIGDLVAIKDVQATTVQPEQPEQPKHRGDGRR
ncbi:hypothetical protein [Nostoc sp. 'Peltigera membranacea cyanobiont' N6]|uniref:hypothetical protein n=1 Tax=Nostoc sp. 'Peltigera membranacea cyanobiont' N6 TaxID=1261031 RepID=UPI0015E27779|nr:hypothetical protein [Nostoc sp. 'Peltigera membranacea cyanobiont' N6]